MEYCIQCGFPMGEDGTGFYCAVCWYLMYGVTSEPVIIQISAELPPRITQPLPPLDPPCRPEPKPKRKKLFGWL